MDDYDENDEYYEGEINDTTNLEEDDEEEEDVWDDSALIAAWDSAVKEYQATNRIEVLENFHSIKTDKTGTKNDTVSETIPTSSNNKVIDIEKSANIIEENTIESFAQLDISSTLDENEDVSTSGFVKKTLVSEQKQNKQKSPEQKIKETRQIIPQTALTSGSYQPHPIKTTTYPHHFPGYYSYPPPSATSSTTHSFNEQIKKTTEQEESNLPPTEEATTSNVHDSYEHYGYYGYSNYYPPPPPLSSDSQPLPHSSSMPTDSNTPFPGQMPKPPAPMPDFDDEALTNLIMAWYYSGYYTGLHHGRKGR